MIHFCELAFSFVLRASHHRPFPAIPVFSLWFPSESFSSCPTSLRAAPCPDPGLFPEMNDLIHVSQQPCEVGAVVIHMLQRKEAGIQQIQGLAERHTGK